MSKTIKMKITGKQDDLISVIDHLPLDGLERMKIKNPSKKNKQTRVLTLNADVFNHLFEDKKRC